MRSAIKKCSTCKMAVVMQLLTSHTIKNAFVMLSVRSLRNFTFGTRDAKNYFHLTLPLETTLTCMGCWERVSVSAWLGFPLDFRPMGSVCHFDRVCAWGIEQEREWQTGREETVKRLANSFLGSWVGRDTCWEWDEGQSVYVTHTPWPGFNNCAGAPEWLEISFEVPKKSVYVRNVER